MRAALWRRGRLGGVALGLAVLVVAAMTTLGAARGATALEVRMRYSRFEPAHLVVPRGRPVSITLRNDDPIDHEWIVGDERTHAAHRDGTEPVHDSRPTEVSVPALTARTTVVTFAEAGTLRFVCHLPGHEAYGMAGVIEVR